MLDLEVWLKAFDFEAFFISAEPAALFDRIGKESKHAFGWLGVTAFEYEGVVGYVRICMVLFSLGKCDSLVSTKVSNLVRAIVKWRLKYWLKAGWDWSV